MQWRLMMERDWKKSPKKKEKREYKKHAKTPKSSKAQSVKEWALQKCSPKALPARNSLVKANRKGGMVVRIKDSPDSSSESESYHESTSDGLSNVILRSDTLRENLDDGQRTDPPVKTTAANKVAPKLVLPLSLSRARPPEHHLPVQTRVQSQTINAWCQKGPPSVLREFLKTVGLFVGRNCPGPSSQAPNASGWKQSDPNSGGRTQTVLCPPPTCDSPRQFGKRLGQRRGPSSWRSKGAGYGQRSRRGHAGFPMF